MTAPVKAPQKTRKRIRSCCHRRQQYHARQRRSTTGTYRVRVSPAAASVNRQRFARFVERVLADARDRGMNDEAIAEATSVSPSTFHRWRRGDFATTPDV